MGADLALAALRHALQHRMVNPGLVHHSDCGIQYCCRPYLALLEDFRVRISMSRPGRPWENGRMESFMKTLKTEQIDGRPYATITEARAALTVFLERVYNRERLHSALGLLPTGRVRAGLSGCSLTRASGMSFLRQWEIYPDMSLRLFSAEYSWRVAFQQSPLPLPQPPSFCPNHPRCHNAFSSSGAIPSFPCIIHGVQFTSVASFHKTANLTRSRAQSKRISKLSGVCRRERGKFRRAAGGHGSGISSLIVVPAP